jgi:hypothetical protein
MGEVRKIKHKNDGKVELWEAPEEEMEKGDEVELEKAHEEKLRGAEKEADEEDGV